jgi:hypothetical protein
LVPLAGTAHRMLALHVLHVVGNIITAFAFMQVDGADRQAQNRGYKAGRIRFVPLASTAHRLLALQVMRVVSNSITAFAFMQGDGADD